MELRLLPAAHPDFLAGLSVQNQIPANSELKPKPWGEYCVCGTIQLQQKSWWRGTKRFFLGQKSYKLKVLHPWKEMTYKMMENIQNHI